MYVLIEAKRGNRSDERDGRGDQEERLHGRVGAARGGVSTPSAVGCFLTHSGWNSTMEGMVAGVPQICWPYFGDQMVNSRFVSEVWRVGLDMKDTCDRNIVVKMVREVMEGESALELRSSVARMADLARKSIEENGTSRANFESLVSYIKSTALTGGS